MIKTVAIFCGSSTGSDPVFAKEAERLAEFFADRKLDLVYGGSNIGIMGIVARTMLSFGRHVTGVIPTALYEKVEHLEVTDLLVVDTMHQRKAAMYQKADAFVALPGGIGTFEELLEVYTWNQLGYLAKPAALYSIDGYYDHLVAQLSKGVDSGFISKRQFEQLIVTDDPGHLLDSLNEYTYAYQPKWKKDS